MLAIGIVVDDAIVVVENIERWLEQGVEPREAARKAMDEVTGPVIAVALVLFAVFVPAAFLGGITGQFFRQFAVTIAVSTVISAFNSLTLSPALAAILLQAARRQARSVDLAAGHLLWAGSSACSTSSSASARPLYVGVVAHCSARQPDRAAGLRRPAGADLLAIQPRPDRLHSRSRTRATCCSTCSCPTRPRSSARRRSWRRSKSIAHDTPGVAHTVGISGQSLILGANAPNLGSMYVMLDEFSQRAARH